MSQIAASAAMPHDHDHGHHADLSAANTTISSAGPLGLGLVGLGVVCIALTVVGGFTYGVKHGLGAYHVGAMSALAMALGCTFWVMAFHLTQAGWSVTLRRQFENVMSLLPVAAAMVAPVLVIEIWQGGHLFAWMSNKAGGVAAGDVLLAEKSAYLNPLFFMIRAVVYVFLWLFVSRWLWNYSRDQDLTGDKWLTNRARFTSAWSLPLFALSIAFAAFDWLMSMDYRFFSTMWGVYYFAGGVFSSVPLVVLICAWLKSAGKLKGLVTEEHYHDMAKLMFGFTVFWAYIGFSQYFLIWYANIPEETAFYVARKTGGWEHLSRFLVIGHFAIPFYILLWRFVRRSVLLLSIMAVWAILLEMVDMAWIVRPMIYAGEADSVKIGRVWLDIVGAVGPVALFAGLVFLKTAKGPLIPTRDPRLSEALEHKNYV
jgi:hypothetical protein